MMGVHLCGIGAIESNSGRCYAAGSPRDVYAGIQGGNATLNIGVLGLLAGIHWWGYAMSAVCLCKVLMLVLNSGVPEETHETPLKGYGYADNQW